MRCSWWGVAFLLYFAVRSAVVGRSESAYFNALDIIDLQRRLGFFWEDNMNGHAIAGGLILVLACDARLGLDSDYRVGLNEVAIGASFPKVAFEIVRLRLTTAQASELLLGAAIYPASHAVRLGVVDELLPGDAFEEAVLDRAAHLGAFPREAYAHTKAALVAEAATRVEAETTEEAARGAAVWMTPESIAARESQRQKLGKGD